MTASSGSEAGALGAFVLFPAAHLESVPRGDLSVELGPSWFIDNQDLHLAVDDRISVTGSRVKTNGVESLIAIEVRRGNEALSLRSTDGTPVWVAWRWRTPSAGASR